MFYAKIYKNIFLSKYISIKIELFPEKSYICPYMHVRQHIVFLTGAGISADSGLRTFRDPEGIWAKVDPQDFCTASALRENPERVLAFYNKRRRVILDAEPNEAHRIIASLEQVHDVTVITQNVDDLHERAGSRGVVHLHGELTKVTSSRSRHNQDCIMDYPLDRPILPGDRALDGSQLRPSVVFFDEFPDNATLAERISREADVFVVVGTSLSVGIAPDLVRLPRKDIPRYVIDPDDLSDRLPKGYIVLRENAIEGMRRFRREALEGFPKFTRMMDGATE